MQITPANQVYVQVKYRLSGARPDVQHSPVTLLDALLSRNICRYQMAMPDQCRVFRLGLL